MDQKKPEYLRPALIAGAVAGLLSGLPIISVGNCVCCLWIVGGAAMATRLLAKNTVSILTSGDGAIVGALTGIVAAVVDTIVKIPFQPYNMALARRIIDKVSEFGTDMPPGLDGLFEGGSGILSPGWFLLGLFISAAVFAAMGVLGGIIGIAVFAKKNPQAPLPAAPPSAPQDPPHAA
jgi:hypothetical protein